MTSILEGDQNEMTNATIDSKLSRQHEDIARRFDLLADDLSAFADVVEEWGKPGNLNPAQALGMISLSDNLADRGRSLLGDDLVGDKTKSSHGNEASIALGVSWHGKGANTSKLAYAMFYAMKEQATFGDRIDLRSRMDVPAQSIRCYASSARVVADIARSVASGKYSRIG